MAVCELQMVQMRDDSEQIPKWKLAVETEGVELLPSGACELFACPFRYDTVRLCWRDTGNQVDITKEFIGESGYCLARQPDVD